MSENRPWYRSVCVGGKEESSIEEQVDFTELDSGVRGETEDSSQSIDLDIRYWRYRLDIRTVLGK